MIMVYTTPELAKLLHEHRDLENFPAKGKYKSLVSWLSNKQAKLVPLAQGADLGPLLNYFQLQANSKITEEDLADLLKLPGIDGAYDKPEDSPPL